MKLSDYLDEGLIIADLKSTTKHAVLRELLEPVGEKHPGLDLDRAAAVLMEREQLGTTGIGDGIAIPHGKLDHLDQIVLVVGRSLSGVEFSALDFKPCTIFFLVLAPERVAGVHLRILAHISRLLKDAGFRSLFAGAEGRAGLWRLLREA